MIFARILLDPAPEPSGGGNNPAPAPAGDPNAGFNAALKKHGDDAAAMARTVYADNERLRADNAALSGKVPKEGAVVLSGDELASYQELIKLGKPAEIRTALEAGSSASKEVAGYKRRDLMAEAAAPYGFNPTVLGTLAGDDLRIEVKDGTRNGKPGRVAEVVTVSKDAKGADVETRTALDKYAEKNPTWSAFLPALRQAAPAKPGGSPPAGGGQPKPEAAATTYRSMVR